MTSQTPVASKEAVDELVKLLRAFYELIKDATECSPLGGIPSGHLYSLVMHNMPLELYTKIITTLKEMNLVTETNHLLYATK